MNICLMIEFFFQILLFYQTVKYSNTCPNKVRFGNLERSSLESQKKIVPSKYSLSYCLHENKINWKKLFRICYADKKIVYYDKSNCLYSIDLTYIIRNVELGFLTNENIDYRQAFEFLARNFITGKIIAMSYRNNLRIYLLNEFGKVLRYNAKRNNIKELMSYSGFENYNIFKAYMFRLDIFLLTMEGNIIICKRGIICEHKNCGYIFQTYVRALTLHGNLLFIGLQSGTVRNFFFLSSK